MARHFIKAPAVGKGELSKSRAQLQVQQRQQGMDSPRGRARRSVEGKLPRGTWFPGSGMLGLRLGVGLGFGRVHWPLPSAGQAHRLALSLLQTPGGSRGRPWSPSCWVPCSSVAWQASPGWWFAGGKSPLFSSFRSYGPGWRCCFFIFLEPVESTGVQTHLSPELLCSVLAFLALSFCSR